MAEPFAAPGAAGGSRRLARSDAVDADQLDGLFAQSPVSLLGHSVAAVVVLLLYWPRVAPPLWWSWAAVFALILIWRADLARRYFQAVHAARAEPGVVGAALECWQWRWDLSLLASGAAWSLGVGLFYGAGHTLDRLVLFLVVSGTCIGSPANRYRIFLSYALLCFVPMVVLVAWDDWPAGLPLASVALIAFMGTAFIGARYHRLFTQMVALKARQGQLAEQLAREKSVVEAAMRAKTDFFAAANHDLRQPLHAIVLYSQALSQRQVDAHSAELCAGVVESVAALEGMFNELLDLHRLDSGAIELQVCNFFMREVYARLALQLKPEAFDKGLELKFLGGDRVVRSDPVMLERVLRNLVANALRYTEDGGVLVTCRARGAQILLQVWDTGIGIRAEALPHIFEEFYQVGGERRLAPHHRRGSGLGLAIVRRLADLMQARLAVRSEVDRGSVFTLGLPAGDAAAVVPPAGQASAAVRVTLNNAWVVVVEDDPAVLKAVTLLLQRWGAAVLGFNSLADVLDWAQSAEANPRGPDLLIVDHGLPQGHTGLEVIVALRRHFAQEIPAIVVSGRSEPIDVSATELQNCHVLSKPVAPNRLRALVSAKLAHGLSQRSPLADRAPEPSGGRIQSAPQQEP